MALEQYHAKRDFRVTAEPRGRKGRAAAKEAGGIFVVQKHDATRLHYDFRLEHGGVLWSWAVTRGPSLDPSEKRLAVHVEDHPLDYASFEGIIPEGQYGAGAVIVWDQGDWIPEGDPAAGMKKGHLRFALEGDKLKGTWHLVRLRPRSGEKRDNWLLIKSDDEYADRKNDILEDAPQSVKSGQTIDQVGNDPDARRWKSNRKAKPAADKPRTAAPRASTKNARKAGADAAKLPPFIPPCLARLERSAPPGDEWLHEVKFDGYRIQAHVAAGHVRLYTRTGLDWTDRFGKPISAALAGLEVASAVIDGEIVVLLNNGVSSFSELQLALSEGRTDRMILYAFDLLWLDGQDLRGEPVIDRKEKLRDFMPAVDEHGQLRFSEHFSEPGKVMLEHACRMGLEGVISKRADAPYRSGRGHDWVKSKCTLRQEFVIAGYLPSQASGRGIRSLVLAYHDDDGKLRPVGHVGTGFSGKVMADLTRKLEALKTDASPFSGAAAREKGVIWVKPELVAEIEFRSWTRGGNIRQGSFQGLREDKPAAEIVMEKPDKPEKSAKRPAAKSSAKLASTKSAAIKGAAVETSVKLSHPEKELWPVEHVSKQDLLDHYALVWPRMRQFVVNRPLALVRAPDGIEGQRFFQKHSMPGMRPSILKSNDPEDNEEFLYVEDFDGLASLVQIGTVEIHIWGATVEHIGMPDQFVFDLDPDEGLDVEDVRKAALEFHERLDELGLANYVKVSGGKGYHIVVPLKPKADWAEVKGFSHQFAEAMEQAAPDRYTATLSKKARKGKIFIDYLRNGRGSTTVGAYSSRAKKGATVSVPVTWEMIADGVDPADFSIGSAALKKLLGKPDPWADFFEKGKPLDRK